MATTGLRSARYFSLLALAIQNTILVLLMRYTRTVSGPLYLASTAVFMGELMKLVISIGMFYYQRVSFYPRRYSPLDWSVIIEMLNELFGPDSQAWRLSIPAILYAMQNNVLYKAVTLLDAATFQVTYQMKILTTALFSVFMLGKQLGRIQWLSLFLLSIGVALVQLPANNGNAVSLDNSHEEGDKFVGLLAVIVASCISAVAGVYFEMILKREDQSSSSWSPTKSLPTNMVRQRRLSVGRQKAESKVDVIWVKNIQLAVFSGIMAAVGCWLIDGETIRQQGFWNGYYLSTWLVILIQAAGGLLVALVVKYADNILKGFATSISIIISTIFSMLLFPDFQLTMQFLLGSSIVILATLLYSM